MSEESILTIIFSTVLSVGLSTAVTWFLGPMETLRQDEARRNLELRRRLRRDLEPLARDLKIVEGQRRQLEEVGRATMTTGLFERFGRRLWPVVRALDDPDLGTGLAKELEAGLRTLFGSYGLEFLSTRELSELKGLNTLEGLEERHAHEDFLLLAIGAADANLESIHKAQECVWRLMRLLDDRLISIV
jgi:hypothetical protein